MRYTFVAAFVLGIMLLIGGCSLAEGGSGETGGSGSGEMATVTRVVDGDTIEVRMDGQTYDVRYVGVNTPEDDEPCYDEATEANAELVAGQDVRLERDESETDRYDRLLRYVYVDDTFVNAELVRDGWAEAVLYQPDDREHDRFIDLEQAAADAGRGCHPTGIFDDGTYER